MKDFDLIESFADMRHEFGEHVVSSDTIYGGSCALLKDFLPTKAGVGVTFVDATDLEKVEAAFWPGALSG